MSLRISTISTTLSYLTWWNKLIISQRQCSSSTLNLLSSNKSHSQKHRLRIAPLKKIKKASHPKRVSKKVVHHKNKNHHKNHQTNPRQLIINPQPKSNKNNKTPQTPSKANKPSNAKHYHWPKTSYNSSKRSYCHKSANLEYQECLNRISKHKYLINCRMCLIRISRRYLVRRYMLKLISMGLGDLSRIGWNLWTLLLRIWRIWRKCLRLLGFFRRKRLGFRPVKRRHTTWSFEPY